MLRFQNFCRPPGQPGLAAPFSWAVGQKSKFRSQRFVCHVVSIPKRRDTTPLPQNPRRRQIWRKPAFLGSRPDPVGPGVRVTRPKITCEELSGPWKFHTDPSNGSKVTALFWSDGCRDTQTFTTITNHPCTIGKFFFFAYMWEERRENLQTLRISTSSLCEG